MKSVPGCLDVLALGDLAALGAGVRHVVRVAILAVHGLPKLVTSPLDAVPAARAGGGSLGLETLLTDWFVLKEQVRSPEFVIAVVTLHTLWVIVGVVVHHAVPHDLLLAHGARLLVGLVAIGAIGLLIFGEEFSIKFLLASVTPEAFFVEDLAKCGAAILCQLPLAVITTLVRLLDCLDGSVPDPGHHLRVAQVDAAVAGAEVSSEPLGGRGGGPW